MLKRKKTTGGYFTVRVQTSKDRSKHKPKP